MTFEKIKNYFVNKKNKNRVFYAVVLKDEDAVHIVEQQVLEIMLVDNCSLQSMWSCSYTANLGSREGTDGKTYEKHVLSDAGRIYYKSLKIDSFAPKYLEALDEINDNNINPTKWAEEKGEIRWNFKRNKIEKAYKCNADALEKDLNDQQVEAEAITL